MSRQVKARSFTFISDRNDGLMLSICLPDEHLFIRITDYMAALALSQLAEHNAEVARQSIAVGHEEMQPPCDV